MKTPVLLAASLFLITATTASAQDKPAATPKPPAPAPSQPAITPPATGKPSKPAPSGDPYTLKTCPVSGEPLGSMGEPVVKEYDGREVRLCCDGCLGAFEADTAKHWAKVDAEMIKQQTPHYPLDTCIVSGEKLGSMGETHDVVYRNRLVRLCCKGCVKDFEKSPATYLAKLDEAVIARQSPSYPTKTCIVSNEPLEGGDMKPVDMVVANRLVRLCCKSCAQDLRKDPAKYLDRLDAATKPAAAAPTPAPKKPDR